MNDEQPTGDLVTMTAEIVAAYVANNSVGTGDVGTLIGSVHASLATLGQEPEQPSDDAKPTGAVTPRKSLSNPAHIISMIDGKPYKMLTRHLRNNGYTPASYREVFGLPRDYPMVAPDYSNKRRAVALETGLGRKPAASSAAAEEPAPARRGRKPVAKPDEAVAKAPARRDRPPRALGDAKAAAKGISAASNRRPLPQISATLSTSTSSSPT